MPRSLINILRGSLIIAAIVGELTLSNGMMILVIAAAGIINRALVMYQEAQATRQAEQDGIQRAFAVIKSQAVTPLEPTQRETMDRSRDVARSGRSSDR